MSLHGLMKIHRSGHLFCFLFMIFLVSVARTSPAEMCEDEDLTNLEFCPIRPGINTNFLDLHKHAYLVCEDDILPLCSETAYLDDKKQTLLISPHGGELNTTNTNTNTTTNSTTGAVTDATTTSKEKCMSCEEICDEHKTRCDLSEFIQKSRSTYDGFLKVKEKTDTDVLLNTTRTNEEIITSTGGHGHELASTESHQQLKDNLKKNRYSNGRDQDSYPKVYFDVFFPKEQRKPKSDQVETILDRFNYKGEGRKRQFRRLGREKLRNGKWKW